MSVANLRLKSVAEGIADAACDLDWLANQIDSVVLRDELKAICLRAHAVALSVARRAGVTIYAEDDDDDREAA